MNNVLLFPSKNTVDTSQRIRSYGLDMLIVFTLKFALEFAFYGFVINTMYFLNLSVKQELLMLSLPIHFGLLLSVMFFYFTATQIFMGRTIGQAWQKINVSDNATQACIKRSFAYTAYYLTSGLLSIFYFSNKRSFAESFSNSTFNTQEQKVILINVETLSEAA